MRSFIHYCLGFLAFGFIGETFAQEVPGVMYMERPTFLSQDMPEEISCSKVERKGNIQHYAKCASDKQLWYQESVYMGYTDLSDTWVETVMPWAMIFTCRNSHCTDENGELVGVNSHSGPEWIMGNILKGYYVVSNATDDVTLHRRGTGPYGDKFPDYYIHDEQDVSTSAPPTHTTYDLWCNQQSDLCTFSDDEGVKYKLGREYLPDHVPMATNTSECMLEVCYDENGDIIGLNPDYHLFN